MKVGKVIGNIWATRKEDKLAGLKLMIVQPVSLTTGEAYGTPLVASDVISMSMEAQREPLPADRTFR